MRNASRVDIAKDRPTLTVVVQDRYRLAHLIEKKINVAQRDVEWLYRWHLHSPRSSTSPCFPLQSA
jgi:hypothetical protein